VRPDGWISVTTRDPVLVARNIRHDLELAADTWLGENVRPDDWAGGLPIYRCSRTLMNTILLLERFFNVRPQTSEAVVDYCAAIASEVEDELLDQALGATDLAEDESNAPSLILAVRGDLERLADEVLGLNNRPPGWIDNTDINSDTLAIDILTDMETLADIVLGRSVRPPGWIGQLRTSLQAEVAIYEIEGSVEGPDASGAGYTPAEFLDYVQDLRLFRKRRLAE